MLEQIKTTVQDVLSELPPPSQENTHVCLKNHQQEQKIYEKKQFFEKHAAVALGGIRAVQTFTADKFMATDCNVAVFRACLAFRATFDSIYMWGPTGTGKSHLGAIAARLGPSFPNGVLTRTPMQINREIRSAGSASEESEIICRYGNLPVLVLDDVGAGKETEFAITLLYEIIQHRYMNRPGGLIVTSNLDLNALAIKFGDDRISSRLAGMCKIFELTGEDWRLRR